MNRILQYLCVFSLILPASISLAVEAPDFNKDVLPILRKHCNGCHNAKEAEGGLVLEDFARTMKGGENGLVIMPGNSGQSRLWKLVTGQQEPKMPPKDQIAPSANDLAAIKAWIDGGAKAPVGGIAATGLWTRKIATQGTVRQPITSIAVSSDGRWIAAARPGAVQILNAQDRTAVQLLTGHSGQINDVSFSANNQWLIVAAGESGLAGEATLWKTADWSRGPVFRGHQDSIYSARMSPDSRLLATGSYDREIQIWDVGRTEILRTATGHNDAIYGLSFSPNGRFLASASGDRTVKLWDVNTGKRLDTFAQPAKDQSTVAFSPDGQCVAAGGVDLRLRIWRISDAAVEGTNPILYARFAHEGPILKVVYAPDGRLLATSSEDGLIKFWETKTYTQVAVLEKQPDWSAALCFSHDNRQLLIGRMNGDIVYSSVDPRWGDAPSFLVPLVESTEGSLDGAVSAASIVETEPNDRPLEANNLAIPGSVQGVFQKTGPGASDVDHFRIEAKRGQTWILETNAARSGSLADTKIEILDEDGRPVVRAQLQAVRDSWINFRPIDSSSPDVRLEFWEEMDLNQFVYLNGEICKTFRAPQGPDSGFQLYTSNGKRRNYFDTSATAHAKDEPCYIVEPYPAGSKIVENGLPVFPLYFANDDEASRKLDKDSRLTFTVPSDGRYLVKVFDVRGATGEKHNYTLTVRAPRPDFGLTVNTMNPKVPAGSGQRLKFTLDRIDNFDGEVRIDIVGLPSGFSASSPVVIAAGHIETNSVLTATADAADPTESDWKRATVLATGVVQGRLVTKTIGSLGEIRRDKEPQFRVTLVPDGPQTGDTAGLVIRPGTTITARILVERNGFDGDLKFDVDNLPHGIIVDNIGLSGVLVRAKETERQIFLTARPWVQETTRLIHAVSQGQGNQATRPLSLHVLSSSEVIAAGTSASQ